jgi:DNA-binding XRE family transcriptional regulator
MTFQQYIEAIGMQKLAETLGITRQNVHHWHICKQAPRPEMAYRLIALSNGLLSWEKIYQPYIEESLKGKKFDVPLGENFGAQIEFGFIDKK